jgi:hypothetical protein
VNTYNLTSAQNTLYDEVIREALADDDRSLSEILAGKQGQYVAADVAAVREALAGLGRALASSP